VEDQGVDGRMDSEWILGKLAAGCVVDPVSSGYGPVASSCKYGDEPSGSGATELRRYDSSLAPQCHGSEIALNRHYA
jgi:hypothetical protein